MEKEKEVEGKEKKRSFGNESCLVAACAWSLRQGLRLYLLEGEASCWRTLCDMTPSGALRTSITDNLLPGLEGSFSLVTCMHCSALERPLLLEHWEEAPLAGSSAASVGDPVEESHQ